MMTEISILSELSYQLEFPSCMVILFQPPQHPPPYSCSVKTYTANNVSTATVDFLTAKPRTLSLNN